MLREPDAARRALAEGLDAAIALGLPWLKAAALLAFAEHLEAQAEAGCASRVLAFAAEQPSTSALDRDRFRAHLERPGAPASANAAWPGIGFDELLHRIVAEAELAHAPMIALLRGSA